MKATPTIPPQLQTPTVHAGYQAQQEALKLEHELETKRRARLVADLEEYARTADGRLTKRFAMIGALGTVFMVLKEAIPWLLGLFK